MIAAMEVDTQRNTCTALHMAVFEDYQGRGIGTTFYRDYLPKMAKKGLRSCQTWIEKDNVQSQGFHAKMGFTPDNKAWDTIILREPS
jgi:L-amino acid N-acyltransferase YncA